MTSHTLYLDSNSTTRSTTMSSDHYPAFKITLQLCPNYYKTIDLLQLCLILGLHSTVVPDIQRSAIKMCFIILGLHVTESIFRDFYNICYTCYSCTLFLTFLERGTTLQLSLAMWDPCWGCTVEHCVVFYIMMNQVVIRVVKWLPTATGQLSDRRYDNYTYQ